MELTANGDFFVITMKEEQNLVNANFVAKLNGLLDNVEKSIGQKALIITATGKFFSNGLDLAWIGGNAPKVNDFFKDFWKLLARLTVFPIPTLALVNGHSYGAGLFLALACDWRVMRADKGFICAPEVLIGLPLSQFRHLLNKLSGLSARTAILTGKRYSGDEAAKAGIVDFSVAEADMEKTAKSVLQPLLPLSVNRSNYNALKMDLYGDIYKALNEVVEVKAKF